MRGRSARRCCRSACVVDVYASRLENAPQSLDLLLILLNDLGVPLFKVIDVSLHEDDLVHLLCNCRDKIRC